MKPLKVGILGATGTVGRKFAYLLQSHPWFEVRVLASSSRTAGKTFSQALAPLPVPAAFSDFILYDVKKDMRKIASEVDFVFCAIGGDPAEVAALEESYAKLEIPVVSNNSALRAKDDVPMVIPELNPDHLSVIPYQRRRLGTKRGFCAVKSNCSLQSYLPLLFPLRKYGLQKVIVTTCQAASGAGKRLEDFPSLAQNLIPYIPLEEEKSELEPLKILGSVLSGKICPAKEPIVSAHCTRVPVADGHTATVSVLFRSSPTESEILKAWERFLPETNLLKLPSAPERFITYFEDPYHPQPKSDCNTENGMGICAGRLRKDPVFDYKFIGLSHNTVRGAAGGGILLAELLTVKGYI